MIRRSYILVILAVGCFFDSTSRALPAVAASSAQIAPRIVKNISYPAATLALNHGATISISTASGSAPQRIGSATLPRPRDTTSRAERYA
jgi:hypothetical protein